MIKTTKHYEFNNSEVYFDDNELYLKDKDGQFKQLDLTKTLAEILEDSNMINFKITVELEEPVK